ncbi:type III secretion system [Caudoviricetes sp.]|nr:type III secretion system [Caudoviricetes sp.]
MTNTEQSLRNRISYLEEEVRQLKEILLPKHNPFYGKLPLTPQQYAILHAIYRVDIATNDYIDRVATEFSNETRKTDCMSSYIRAKVAVHHLRRKLDPYKIKITTLPSIGYMINRHMKAKLKKIIEDKHD